VDSGTSRLSGLRLLPATVVINSRKLSRLGVFVNDYSVPEVVSKVPLNEQQSNNKQVVAGEHAMAAETQVNRSVVSG
jgi:hypothetical protein